MYKVKLEITFGEDTTGEGYPAGWLEGALQYLFDTYNADGSLVAVSYQFDGMDKPIELGIGS